MLKVEIRSNHLFQVFILYYAAIHPQFLIGKSFVGIDLSPPFHQLDHDPQAYQS